MKRFIFGLLAIALTASTAFAEGDITLGDALGTDQSKSKSSNWMKKSWEASKEFVGNGWEKTKDITDETWKRASVSPRLKLDLFSKTFENGYFIDSYVKYTWRAKPANIANYQLRSDIWEANIAGGYAKDFSARIEGKLIVNFSRLILSEDKGEILPIYNPVDNLPWNAERAKKLKPGDLVQIQLQGSGSVGKTNNEEGSGGMSITPGVGVGATRSSQLWIEVYKRRDGKVRFRMLAARTPLTISASAYVRPLETIDWVSGFAGKPINKFGQRLVDSCNFLGASADFNPSDATRPDTMSAQYIVDISKKEGADAYNGLMNIVTHIEVLTILNFFKSGKDLAPKLLEYVKPIEDLYQKNRAIAQDLRSVDRSFMGRSLNDFLNIEVGSKCASSFWYQLTENISQNLMDVTAVNPDGSRKRFQFMSASKDFNFKFLFKIFQIVDSKRVNGLMEANQNPAGGQLPFVPERLQDMMISRDFSDKKMTAKKIGYFKELLHFTSPRIASYINWGTFDNGKNKEIAYLRYNYIFHENTFHALPAMSEREIYNRLRALVDRYPQPDQIPNQTPFREESGRESAYRLPMLMDEKQAIATNAVAAKDIFFSTPRDRFEADIRELAIQWYLTLNSPNLKQRMDALRSMSQKEILHDIGMAFIIQILEEQNLNIWDYIHFDISGGSDDKSLVTGTFGQNGLSSLYATIQYIIQVINNREIDHQFMFDESDFNAGANAAQKNPLPNQP